MGKKMKLPFLSHSKSLDPKLSSSSSSPPWPWPSCGGNLKTLSFRAKDDAFRTYNSAFLDTQITPPDSFFTVSSSSRSFSTMSDDSGDPVESVIRGLRSDRLFFEPEQSSLLVATPPLEDQEKVDDQAQDEDEDEDEDDRVVYKESEKLSMESNNPYEDFRRSMEEMVEAHGLKDFQGLEELLRCYLKINGKNNHGYIMGAFIDLLVSLSFTSSSSSTLSTSTSTSTTTISTTRTSSSLSSTNSPSSPLSLPSSSLTTPCLSSMDDHDHDNDDGNHDNDDDEDDDDHHVSS